MESIPVKRKRGRPPKIKPDPQEEVKGLPEMSRLDVLRTEAEILADRNGHDLNTWIDELGWCHTSCSRCRAVISVAEAPPPGAATIQPDKKMQGPCS